MRIRLSLVLILVTFGAVGCSWSSSGLEHDYKISHHQLPVEPEYGTTAWVQPPTVVPSDVEQSGFTEGGAPLIKPPDSPAPSSGTSPKLPRAASSRRY